MNAKTKLPRVLSVRLARLTDDWQKLTDLKLSPVDGDFGYYDLYVRGLAERRTEPIVTNGISRGERVFYRRREAAEL